MMTFSEFKEDCIAEVSELQNKFIKRYDLNSYERWTFDDAFGLFHFESDNGRKLNFRYNLVGSFSKNTSTWKWCGIMKISNRGFAEELMKPASKRRCLLNRRVNPYQRSLLPRVAGKSATNSEVS